MVIYDETRSSESHYFSPLPLPFFSLVSSSLVPMNSFSRFHALSKVLDMEEEEELSFVAFAPSTPAPKATTTRESDSRKRRGREGSDLLSRTLTTNLSVSV
jgi:hypothetical protein